MAPAAKLLVRAVSSPEALVSTPAQPPPPVYRTPVPVHSLRERCVRCWLTFSAISAISTETGAGQTPMTAHVTERDTHWRETPREG